METVQTHHDGTKRRKISTGSHTFKKGNITLLRIWNFTTYSYGEFKLSPTLNMIIGPNGTGKSTFVAAVCLGLGGRVDLIKRKNMDSMIKSGEKECRIEITLKDEEGSPDVVIERISHLKLVRSTWRINGESTDVMSVRQTVRSLNIQLDNLCHFLPQERVAEFASLAPEKLLLETERTIGDSSLLQQHQLLIELDEKWVEVSKKAESLEETVKDLEADVEKFEQEAQKYQEYEVKLKEIHSHRKLLPYAKLQDVKEQMKHLKEVRDRAKQELQEFSTNSKPLATHKKVAENSMKKIDASLKALKETIASLTKNTEDVSAKATKCLEEIEEMKNEIESLQSRTENQKRELQKAIHEKEEMSRKVNKLDVVDEDEISSLSARREAKHEEKSKVEETYDAIKFEMNSEKRQLEACELSYREELRKFKNNDRLEILNTRGTRYRRELMEHAYKAHTFLRKEKEKHDLQYHEAPVVCCRVTHQRYAKYFEKIVDNNTLFSLFFSNEQDYRKVSSVLPKDINVPMRVVANSTVRPPMSVENLKKLGFDGYLSDFITGPDAVIQGLNNRSSLHCIPVALSPIDQNTVKKLLQPGSDGKVPFLRFVVENSLFMVGRSRYGSKQVFYQTEHIGEAHLMGSEGLTEEVKQEIQRRLQDLKLKIERFKDSISKLEKKKQDYQQDLTSLDDELKELDQEFRSLRKKREARLKFEENIKHIESRVHQLSQNTKKDFTQKIAEAETNLMTKYVNYSDFMEEIVRLNEELVGCTIEVKKKELLRQQQENRHLVFQSLLLELEEKKKELTEKYLEAKSKYDEYKKGDAADEIRNQTLTTEEREAVKHLAEVYLAEGRLSESYVLMRIEQLEDDLSVLSHLDRGSLELLKSKKADLEIAEKQVPQLMKQKTDLKMRMDNICSSWERDLTAMVSKISLAFQKNFITVASDGQVELVKSERFKDWKLEILVKFRENSELKVLDHQSQSGGERAVSTIFFIMALQGLTNAPIRIVDEINQGMDPKNEKMAHKYLVHTACKTGSSQYFLVTPKLLTGLFYHPKMAIHCIFTGPLLKKNSGPSEGPGFLNLQRNNYVQS